jgi:hypothetical protein
MAFGIRLFEGETQSLLIFSSLYANLTMSLCHLLLCGGGMKARTYQKVSEAGPVKKAVLWRDAVVPALLAQTQPFDGVMGTIRRVIPKLSRAQRSLRWFIELSLLVAVTLIISACSEQSEQKLCSPASHHHKGRLRQPLEGPTDDLWDRIPPASIPSSSSICMG